MRVIKKELKEAVTAIKRLSTPKTKGEAKLTIQHAHDIEGDESKFYIKASNQDVNIFFEMKNVDNVSVSVTVNPYDLETLLKGKDKELEFELLDAKKEMVLKGESKGISYEPFEGEAKNNLKGLVPLKDPDRFVLILKEAESVFCESHIQSSTYLELTPLSARALEPRRIQYYRFEETFEFEKGFLHQNAVKFLSKTLKGPTSQKMFGDFLVFQNGNGYFAVKLHKHIFVPDFSEIERKEECYSFKVNGEEMNKRLKTFTKNVKEIEITLENQQLILNPRDEKFETQRIDVTEVKGEFQPVVFETNTFKGLFLGYEQDVLVRHQLFGNKPPKNEKAPDEGEEENGYMWWIYGAEKTMMIAGILEPDYEKPWKEAFQKA